MYRRIIMFMQLIKFFMSTQWHFAADNIADVDKRSDRYIIEIHQCTHLAYIVSLSLYLPLPFATE